MPQAQEKTRHQNLLEKLKESSKNYYISNLGKWVVNEGFHKSNATIIRSQGWVSKKNGCYQWATTDPTFEMADDLRVMSNFYMTGRETGVENRRG